MAVGPDEADGAGRDAIGGGEVMEREAGVSAPIGDGGGRGPVTMDLPVEAGERCKVVLARQPGEAVSATKAPGGAGAQAASAIVDAGLGDEAEGRAANG